MAYTTNLTVPQFELVDPLFPKSKTYQGDISRHDYLNAIFYQLKNGCQWRDLPTDFPNWQTVYSQFRRWRLNGTWERVLAALARRERASVKKKKRPAC
jgi:putative transposase